MEKNEFQKPNPELIVLSHADKRPTSSNQIYSAKMSRHLLKTISSKKTKVHKNQPAFWSLRQGVYFELLLELLKCLYVLFELLLLALRRRGLSHCPHTMLIGLKLTQKRCKK